MSTFEVTPFAVGEVSARLGGIAGHVHELHGRMSSHVEAAEHTPAAGALHQLMGQWALMLPVYAQAGARLSGAVAGAAAGYQRSDGAVAAACDGGAEGSGP
jgi:hypothetical protein